MMLIQQAIALCTKCISSHLPNDAVAAASAASARRRCGYSCPEARWGEHEDESFGRRGEGGGEGVAREQVDCTTTLWYVVQF